MGLILISILLTSNFNNEFNFLPVKQAHASDDPPKSYWKLDGNTRDSGSLNVTLHNTYPLYVCGVNATIYCMDPSNPLFGKVDYRNNTFGKSAYFNGYTFLASSFEDQSKYQFLEYNHPFTLEAWIVPHRLNVQGIYDHHYFISKVFTNGTSVTGIACGQQDDGALYCYMRSDQFDTINDVNNRIYQETQKAVPDDIPLKFDFVYMGDGKVTGMLLYINGERAPVILQSPHWTVKHSIQNTQPMVIGNYWIKWINPWTNAYVGQVKIYDYARTSEQIMADFQSDIAGKPNWNTPVHPTIILTAQGDETGIGLNWNSVANATYMIEQSVDNGNWTSLTPSSYVITDYNDYNVTKNHAYSYRISAWNNGQEVTVSNISTIGQAQTVPEFESLAGMIIAVSIIGTITISKRFKL